MAASCLKHSIEGDFNQVTAEEVWNLCNEKLASGKISARSLIKMSNVELICTTDDPADTLEWHKKIAADETFDVRVLPAWRPEKAMNMKKPDYLEYIGKLSQVSGVSVTSFAALIEALKVRMERDGGQSMRI